MSALRGGVTGIYWRVVLPVQGGAVLTLGVGMAACAIYALFRDDGGALELGIPAVGAVVLGGVALWAGRLLPEQPLRPRDGFLAVTMAWVIAAAIGSIPLLVGTELDSVTASYFEAMSGFTTTGATLLTDIPGQPAAVLLWRSMTQWLGGVGIIVLVVAVAPATGMASQRVFYAETSGVTPDRLTPRIADTAKRIMAIYLGLSGLCLVAYLLVGMGLYDAVNHVFTTLATGGFSPKQGSISDFDSLAVELTVILFMVAAGVNFAFYWRLLRGGGLWPQLAEVRTYLAILAAGTVVVAASLLVSGDIEGLGEALRSASFTVVSLTTTTGYTTADFDAWNNFARIGLVALMFVGACAGSTTGGMKTIRVMLLAKAAVQEIRSQLRPSEVHVLRIRGKVFGEDVRRGVMGFFFIYVLVFVLATLAMAAAGLDISTAFSAVAATLNVIGPGLGDVGSTENYGAVAGWGQWVLSACMLIGRLEVFTVLVLLIPGFWRRRGA